MTVTGLLAYEWTVILPLLARDSFDGGADAVGLTFTAMGAGAIVGGLALAGVLKATTNRLVALGLAFAGALLATAAGTALGAYATLRYLRRRGVPSETVVPAGSRGVAAPAPVGPV